MPRYTIRRRARVGWSHLAMAISFSVPRIDGCVTQARCVANGHATQADSAGPAVPVIRSRAQALPSASLAVGRRYRGYAHTLPSSAYIGCVAFHTPADRTCKEARHGS